MLAAQRSDWTDFSIAMTRLLDEKAPTKLRTIGEAR
jgi:hypothetical protein